MLIDLLTFVQADHDSVWHQQHPRPVRPQSQPVDGAEEPSLQARPVRGRRRSGNLCSAQPVWRSFSAVHSVVGAGCKQP